MSRLFDFVDRVAKDYISNLSDEEKEYDYGDTLTKAFFENKQFLNLRRVYKKIYGDYPKGFVKRAKEYVKLTQDEKYNIAYYSETDIKAYVKELAKELWHEEQFVAESEKKGIEYKEIAVYVENIKSIYEEMGCFFTLGNQLAYSSGKNHKRRISAISD